MTLPISVSLSLTNMNWLHPYNCSCSGQQLLDMSDGYFVLILSDISKVLNTQSFDPNSVLPLTSVILLLPYTLIHIL